MARPLCGSDDQVNGNAVMSPVGDIKILAFISTFMLNALTIKRFPVHVGSNVRKCYATGKSLSSGKVSGKQILHYPLDKDLSNG